MQREREKERERGDTGITVVVFVLGQSTAHLDFVVIVGEGRSRWIRWIQVSGASTGGLRCAMNSTHSLEDPSPLTALRCQDPATAKERRQTLPLYNDNEER